MKLATLRPISALHCGSPRPRIAHLALVTALWLSALVRVSTAKDCSRDSTGLVPLTDLGAGSYQGQQGGLYAGGTNGRPAAHDAAGIAIASAIAPLDTLGNPDPAGRVVLISIGMSNATQEFSAFVPKATSDPYKKANVQVIDCAQGGQAADDIKFPNAPYWETVATRLRGHGSSPAQVQVVWLKEANRAPTGPFLPSAGRLRDDLATIVRIIKDKLPNARLCYLTSRIYAGYATTNLNPEPYAYESGFAVKWLIDAQIQGVDSLEYDASAGPVEAPWLSWGPYLWADGLEPRGDRMTWACEAFVEDGTHPSTLGRNLVADSLLAFFRRDATAVPWYLSGPVAVIGERSRGGPMVYPNPGRGRVELAFATRAGERWSLTIADVSGRRLRRLGAGMGTGGAVTLGWDGRGRDGRTSGGGVYWAMLERGSEVESRRLVWLDD
jgi:hypothetical protein